MQYSELYEVPPKLEYWAHQREGMRTERLIRATQLWSRAHCALFSKKYYQKPLTIRCLKSLFFLICPATGAKGQGVLC